MRLLTTLMISILTIILLSFSCGEFLNHLKTITKEKEENLEKTKADLVLRQQKLKEDKSLQESRSDPESVISSLTAFSTNSNNDNVLTNICDDAKKIDQNKSNPSICLSSSDQAAKKSNPPAFESSSDQGAKESNPSTPDASFDQVVNKWNPSSFESSSDQVAAKKQCTDDGSGTSSDGHKGAHIGDNKMSSSDGSGSSSDGGHKGAHIAVNKMSSSVSDMTDSNRGSSDGKTSTGTNDLKTALVTSSEGCSQRSGEDEVSSTAAVVSGIGSQKHGHTHADVVVKTGPRKRKRKHELTSLDEGFILDYREVFMTSNVPQIISTLAGRIIICKFTSSTSY